MAMQESGEFGERGGFIAADAAATADLMHFIRSGSTVTDLVALDPALRRAPRLTPCLEAAIALLELTGSQAKGVLPSSPSPSNNGGLGGLPPVEVGGGKPPA
jgi:hypothetical protein